MYQQITSIKWVKCWRCGLPIVLQVGRAIPIGMEARCPRCGNVRSVSANSFLKASEIPNEWKEITLESIGVTGLNQQKG